MDIGYLNACSVPSGGGLVTSRPFSTSLISTTAMHLYGLTLGLLLPSLALYATDYALAIPYTVSSSPNLASRNPADLSGRTDVINSFPYVRDGDHPNHGHGHAHPAPIIQLNETEVLLHHAPTPPSYWSLDIDNTSGETRYPTLMILHALFMILAFFGALPAGSSSSLPLINATSDSSRQEWLFVL
jgi:hypothetical protein